VVTRLRHGRPRKFCAGHFEDAVPVGFDLKAAYCRCGDAALGAGEAGSGRSRAKVLPGISPKAVAYYNPAGDGARRRNPALRSDSQNDPEGGNTVHFDNPIAAGLEFFKDDPLVVQPDTKFSYSTQGYTVVGCVIEGVSSIEYVDYLREHVFALAGMTQTQADDRVAIIPYRTLFYRTDSSGRAVNADPLDSSYKIPGGGWLSSAEDMAQFEVAVLGDKLVRRSTREVMLTPQKLSDGSLSDYALGWGTRKEEGIATVGHGGGQQGTSTFILLAPDQRAGVVVLANMESVDVSSLATAMLKTVLGKL
jgi:serine beta-lactamase-like protein LACTB, mitochondrial